MSDLIALLIAPFGFAWKRFFGGPVLRAHTFRQAGEASEPAVWLEFSVENPTGKGNWLSTLHTQVVQPVTTTESEVEFRRPGRPERLYPPFSIPPTVPCG